MAAGGGGKPKPQSGACLSPGPDAHGPTHLVVSAPGSLAKTAAQGSAGRRPTPDRDPGPGQFQFQFSPRKILTQSGAHVTLGILFFLAASIWGTRAPPHSTALVRN